MSIEQSAVRSAFCGTGRTGCVLCAPDRTLTFNMADFRRYWQRLLGHSSLATTQRSLGQDKSGDCLLLGTMCVYVEGQALEGVLAWNVVDSDQLGE